MLDGSIQNIKNSGGVPGKELKPNIGIFKFGEITI